MDLCGYLILLMIARDEEKKSSEDYVTVDLKSKGAQVA